jgi:hypothetical protein
MQRSPFISVRELVWRSASPLQSLLRQAQHLERADHLLREHLGEPLSRHCRLANVTRHRVVLHADSPVWSLRLRYRTPDILSVLRQHLRQPDLREVKVRVQPQAPQPAAPQSAPPQLSPRTAVLLRSVAEGIQTPRLREALLRLARHRR